MFAAAAALACWLEELETSLVTSTKRLGCLLMTGSWQKKRMLLLLGLARLFMLPVSGIPPGLLLPDLKRFPLGLALLTAPPFGRMRPLFIGTRLLSILGVPLPVPKFSRTSCFEPILTDCHYILDQVLRNKFCTTLSSRRYVPASIIQKKLTYSSTIYRLTEKHYLALRSRVFAATFDKALASYIAAIALVVPGHLLDYKCAAIYTSLCSWEGFFASGGLSDLLRGVLDFEGDISTLSRWSVGLGLAML